MCTFKIDLSQVFSCKINFYVLLLTFDRSMDQAFQQSLEQKKGLAHHLTHFDALATRQAIKAELAEAIFPELN